MDDLRISVDFSWIIICGVGQFSTFFVVLLSTLVGDRLEAPGKLGGALGSIKDYE